MKVVKIISGITGIVGIFIVSIVLVMNECEFLKNNDEKIQFREVDINSVAASSNMIIKDLSKEDDDTSLLLQEVKMETVPASIIIPPRIEVYDGMTIEELSDKFNRVIGDSYIGGKGGFIASYALDNGVDPYIALAIILHETGCTASCSKLVVSCNNVGGQKGSPGCGGGSYKAFPTLDEGIQGFINNLNRNYFSMGLNTVETIAPKYAESPAWPERINWWVGKIRNS